MAVTLMSQVGHRTQERKQREGMDKQRGGGRKVAQPRGLGGSLGSAPRGAALTQRHGERGPRTFLWKTSLEPLRMASIAV